MTGSSPDRPEDSSRPQRRADGERRREPERVDPFEIAQWRPRRSRTVLVLLLGACAVVALAVWRLAARPQPRANRVLLLLETATQAGQKGAWWAADGQASARCADRLHDALRSLGLDVVRAGDAATRAELEGRGSDEELLDGARNLEAGAVLRGTLKVVRANALTGSDGAQDIVVIIDGAVASTFDDTRIALDERPPRVSHVGKSEEEALLGVCDRVSERLTPLVAAALCELPALKSLRDRPESIKGLDDKVAAERLAPLFKLAKWYRQASAVRSDQAQRLRDRDAKQEHGTLRKQLVSGFLSEDYLVGAGPQDSIITMELPTWLARPEEGKTGYQLKAGHEQIHLHTADAASSRILTELFNIYSYPSVSADGSTVALVADHRQWSKALQVVAVADGTVTEIAHHRSHYFSSPVVSPDGSHVAFWYSTTRDGPSRLEVAEVASKERRVLVPGPWEQMARPAWSADGKSLFVAYQPAGEPTSSVWRIELTSGESQAVLGAALSAAEPDDDAASEGEADAESTAEQRSSSFIRPTLSPQGDFLAVVESAGEDQWLGRVDLATGAYRRLLSATVGRMAIAPDGSRIAFETVGQGDADDPSPGDIELALLPAGGGDLRQLTFNAQKDTLAGWSRDGKRLYGHQGNRDPGGRRFNSRIYWLEP